MTPFETALMFLAVFSAGLLFFAFRKTNAGYLKLSLAFTGAYLFAISMVHLIPGVFSSGNEKIGYFILLGFFIQLTLEFFSEGIEHGHIHVHKHHSTSFPVAMMAGLCLHSFLEGMPLSAQYESHEHSHSLMAGIILHHLPVAFALMSMLRQSGLTKKWSLINLAIFALMAPAGALFSSVLGEADLMNIRQYFDQIMAVVIGIFLHISTTILFETGSDHRFNLYKLLAIGIGAGLALLV